MKYADDGDMGTACVKALRQIEEKDYMARFKAGLLDVSLFFFAECELESVVVQDLAIDTIN